MMNSRFTTFSALMSLLLIMLSLLNLATSPTEAYPRSRDIAVDDDDFLPQTILSYEDDDPQAAAASDDIDLEALLISPPSSSSQKQLRARLNELLSTAITGRSSSSSSPRSRRQMGKRHTCEHHGLCERCAKHTKSHEVYSQCCSNEDGRKWCNDFLNYQMGRK